MNISQLNSSMDTSSLSNENGTGSEITENSSLRFWQSDPYKTTLTAPIQLPSSTSIVQNNKVPRSESSKLGYQMNINAPSYTPYNANYNSLFDRGPMNSSEFFDHSTASHLTVNKSDNNSEELYRVKVDLILKDQIIKSLTTQLNSLHKLRDVKQSSLVGFKMPRNYYELFRDLAETLKQKSDELEDSKQRLEAIIVALAMNPSSTISAGGQYNEQDVAHKIITKLSTLQSENEELLRMMSYSSHSSLLVEVGLLRTEVTQLKQRLSKYEK